MRGMSLLQSCDVLVYDDLISPELLTAAPDSAEKIYMGKRMGRHFAPQEAISAVLIAKAQAGNTVVRLKGGDPFVFGRGGEEILALQAAGIPYESVPGISSAIAIPAAAGIPVTHRGLSQSFHVVTAHTAGSEDGLPAHMENLAHLPGTLIFLMGLSRLEAIVRRLISAGMPPDTPAAVISGGNAASPSAVRGNLENIAHRTRAVKLQPPAVIVVGATACIQVFRPLSSRAAESDAGHARPAAPEFHPSRGFPAGTPPVHTSLTSKNDKGSPAAEAISIIALPSGKRP